jgi:hypothetical protein
VNLKDQLVNFRVRDVYIPELQDVLTELHGNDILQGRVLTVSDNDRQDECYAVVVVQGIREPIVVPIRGILGVL